MKADVKVQILDLLLYEKMVDRVIDGRWCVI